MIVCVCLRCDAVGVLFLEMGRCLVEKSKKGPAVSELTNVNTQAISCGTAVLYAPQAPFFAFYEQAFPLFPRRRRGKFEYKGACKM